MSIQEKEQMYFATEKIENAKYTLEMITYLCCYHKCSYELPH